MKLLKNPFKNDQEYYADSKYVSNSMLSNISVSPKYFEYRLNNPMKASPAMDFGRAFHKFVLEKDQFDLTYDIAPECDKRTKEGKEQWKNYLESLGEKETITLKDYNIISKMSSVILKDNVASDLLSNGEAEKIICWENKEFDVKCKGMLDYYTKYEIMDTKVTRIVDLKTTSTASSKGFLDTIRKYKYHKQAAYYMDAVKADHFYIIAIEKYPPYGMNIFEISGELLQEGRDLYRKELDIYASCLHNKRFPDYGICPYDKDQEREIITLNE